MTASAVAHVAQRVRTPKVRIDFACNNPDNGLFTGRVVKINVPEAEAELTSLQWNILSDRGTPRLRDQGDHIVLSGKRWPVLGKREWYGNWCWTAWWFAPETGWQFLRWLHKRKLFSCDTAEEWFFDLWKAEAWPEAPDQGFLVRWQENGCRREMV